MMMMNSPSDGVARTAAAIASDDPDPHPPPASSSSSVPPPPPRRVVPRRVIRRRGGGVTSSSSRSSSDRGANRVDDDIIPPHVRNNAELNRAISATLPGDYEFEIPKTIARIERSDAVDVALQMPEGLAMYASAIGDILVRFCHRFRPSIHHQSRRRVVDGEG
jgi:2-(3-amino-3-carboxypropyl)histidine synthase